MRLVYSLLGGLLFAIILLSGGQQVYKAGASSVLDNCRLNPITRLNKNEVLLCVIKPINTQGGGGDLNYLRPNGKKTTI